LPTQGASRVRSIIRFWPPLSSFIVTARLWLLVELLEGGHLEARAQTFDAFASVLATTNHRTPDLGGDATTEEFTELVLDNVANR
jgi:isocitrate/isopropylmalate dehydrogenase